LSGLLLLAAGCTTLPERVRTYNADGVHLFQYGDYRDARDDFQSALELAPDDVNLRYNLAQCYERLGDNAKAEAVYRECLERDRDNANCRQALCVFLVRRGRRDEAVKMVQEWLTRQPPQADAYALDGWLRHQAGDLPAAHSRLQQALLIDGNNVAALNEMGLLYEAMHYPERALALYERSLTVRPEQPEIIDRYNRLKRQGVDYPRPG
jgi:tetratricopeptide (TPR) repeat protein